MSRKVKNGFVMATSDNIPKVHPFMLNEWYEKSSFVSAEVRHVKSKKALRQEYADEAVGFVQLQRVRGNPLVTVEATVTPEHRLNSPCYHVRMVIDEPDETVAKCVCLDCQGSAGGCKHALALFWWLISRTELPSTTAADCYWRRSSLSATAKYGEVVEASSIAKRPRLVAPSRQVEAGKLADFRSFCEGLGRQSALSLMVNPHQVVHPLSLHKLSVEYKYSGVTISPSGFLNFVKRHTTPEQYRDAELGSRSQSGSGVWHELRYGRITASYAHTLAQCKTPEGTTVEVVMGAYQFKPTPAIQRGKDLETKVLKAALKEWETRGLMISQEVPFFGASPDAIYGDAVVEVKCPFTEKGVSNYLDKNGKLKPKVKTQLQMQMKMANKKRGLLIVADPKFDLKKNKKYKIVEEKYDPAFINKILDRALTFWNDNIFPKIMGT